MFAVVLCLSLLLSLNKPNAHIILRLPALHVPIALPVNQVSSVLFVKDALCGLFLVRIPFRDECGAGAGLGVPRRGS